MKLSHNKQSSRPQFFNKLDLSGIGINVGKVVDSFKGVGLFGSALLVVGSALVSPEVSAAAYRQDTGGSPLALNSKSPKSNSIKRLDEVPEGYVSTNTEETQFKGRLYWPANTSKYQLLDSNNWDKFMADPTNPKYGRFLPDYGMVSPIEVNDDINAVWNLTKNIRHIQKEKLADLSKRIQDPITKFINDKNASRAERGLPPITETHKIVLRAAGNETFVSLNMAVGDNGLRSGPTMKPSPACEQSGNKSMPPRWSLPTAQQILDLPHPKGLCLQVTAVLTSLHHYADVPSVKNTPQNRDPNWTGGYVESGVFPDGGNWAHSIVSLILKSNGDAAGISKPNEGIYHSDMFAEVISDPTFYSFTPEEREDARKCKVFPRPEHFLVGAKGDSTLMIRYSMTYMEHGSSARATRGFLDWNGGNFYKADVTSVKSIITAGNKLTEEIWNGK